MSTRMLLKLSLLYLWAGPIAAQEFLDTALVSASRFNTNLQSANRNVIVLDGEDLANAPVNSVAEILDFATGIDARQRGIFGTQTDLSIRGGSFEQVLVLLDGVRLSDPQTGHHLMNLPVQKADIERIEILLGGGGYIFGESAFSGAVNIITKKATRNRARINLRGGSFSSYQAGFHQRLRGDNHQSSFSVTRTASDGFKDNTDFGHLNFFGQSRIELEQQQIQLQGGFTQQNFGAQNFYSSVFPEQFEKTRTLFLSAGLQSGDKLQIHRQVYWRRNWDEFQLFREEGQGYYQFENDLFTQGKDTAIVGYGEDGRPVFYSQHNYHRSDVAGGKLEVRFESGAGKTSLAGEYRYEGVVSNNLGEALEAPIPIPASRGAYHLGQQRHNLSLALEQAKELGRMDLSAALLVNYNSAFETDFYPALTAGYRMGKKGKLYASFNRSFRLPSYTDLYYRLGGAVGSEDLRAENSLNYELGYKQLGEHYFFNLSIFRREGRDIIDWIQRCDTCALRATNTSVVNFNGLDFNLKLHGWDFMKGLGLQQAELGYSYLLTDQENFDYQSLYVFDYLRHKISMRARHQFRENLRLSYGLSYQNRNGNYTDANGQQQPYPEVWLINARVSYRWKLAEFFVSAQNLLDQRYFDRGNVELPGLWAWAGVELDLGDR